MSNFQRITPDTALALIDTNANVVDIRDPQSFQIGHISGSVRLDNDNAQEFIAATEHATPLIVCCYHGNSSQPAAAWLAEMGFEEVYSLDGGFELWQQQFPARVSRS